MARAAVNRMESRGSGAWVNIPDAGLIANLLQCIVDIGATIWVGDDHGDTVSGYRKSM